VRAFADEHDRRRLEALLWPLVGARVQEFHAQASQRMPTPRAVVIEAPLLFESGSQSRYTATIAVVAADEIRAQRLRGRDQAQLREREARQLSQAAKASRATHVVVNDGTLEALREQLAAVLEQVGR